MGKFYARKLTALFIVMCIILSSGPFALLVNAAATEVKGHWAETIVTKWIDREIVTGYEDGTFKLDGFIKRSEFAALINRTFGYTSLSETRFLDISGRDWFFDDASKAQAAGYIQGYDDGTFRPNNNITRQEAAVILARICNLENIDKSFGFTDINSIPDWSLWAVVAVAEAGILKGYPDGRFGPTEYLTRAETISILDRLVAEIFTQSGTYGNTNEQTVIDGNAVLLAEDLELVNYHIKGDLLVAESVGEGTIVLDKVDVDGQLTVKGGGSESVVIKNSKVGTLTISKNGVRVSVQNGTKIMHLRVTSPSVIEQDPEDKDIEILDAVLTVGDVALVNLRIKGDLVLDETIGDGVIALENVEVEGTLVENSEDVILMIEEKPPLAQPEEDTTSSRSRVRVTDINVDLTELLLLAGEKAQIKASILPKNASNKRVTWTSNDQNVATVSDGTVTGVNAGTTTITATSVADNTKKATVKVIIFEEGKTFIERTSDIFDTIQEAVDAAEENDTIFVGPGIYNETVKILGDDKVGITLSGAKGAILDGTGFGANERGISINTNDVIVEGFTIKNYSQSYGVIIIGDTEKPLSGIIVRDNIVCENGLGSSGFRGGMYIKDASVVIENNVVGNNHNGGIELTTGVYGSVVKGNIIRGNRNHGIHIGSTGKILPTASVLVEDNLIEDNGSGVLTEHDPISYSIPGHAGVIVWDAGAKIINNSIVNNNSDGIVWIHFEAERWEQSGKQIDEEYYSIENNMIKYNTGSGLVFFTHVSSYKPYGPVDPSASPLVVRNDIKGNSEFGLVAVGSSNPIIEENTFVGNLKGGVNNTWTGASMGTVRWLPITIDATQNYWGAETGPYHSECNTSGKGDSVSGNVFFYPWYKDTEKTVLSAFEGVVNLNTLDSYRSIQQAIDKAEQGDTLMVDANTYTGDLSISVEDLVLKSTHGAGATIIEGNIVIEVDNVSIEGFTIDGEVESLSEELLENILARNEFANESVIVMSGESVFAIRRKTEVSVVNDTQKRGYYSIQNAVNDVVENDIILVNPGEYIENIKIEKPLTLKSTVAHEAVIKGRIDIFFANNVTIKNFKIERVVPNQGPSIKIGAWHTDQQTYGVSDHGVEGIKILDNIIDGQNLGTEDVKNAGIHITNSSVEVHKNHIKGNKGNGIFVDANTVAVALSEICILIEHNVIENNRTGINFNTPITSVFNDSYVDIVENEFIDNTAHGISIGAVPTKFVIEDNIFDGNARSHFSDRRYTYENEEYEISPGKDDIISGNTIIGFYEWKDAGDRWLLEPK